MSGADVFIGENSPLYSTGALGFISHMSICDAPPHRKKRMVDFAGLRRAGSACDPNAAFPNGNPKQAVVEAVIKERRLSAAENNGFFTARGDVF